MDQFEQHARKRPESCRDLDEFEWHFLESLRTETSFSQIRSSNDEAERSYLDLYWRRSPFLLVAWKFEANPSNNAIKKQIVYCLDMLGFNYALDGEDDSIFRIYVSSPSRLCTTKLR
jgi:hypothetical protein